MIELNEVGAKDVGAERGMYGRRHEMWKARAVDNYREVRYGYLGKVVRRCFALNKGRVAKV